MNPPHLKGDEATNSQKQASPLGSYLGWHQADETRNQPIHTIFFINENRQASELVIPNAGSDITLGEAPGVARDMGVARDRWVLFHRTHGAVNAIQRRLRNKVLTICHMVTFGQWCIARVFLIVGSNTVHPKLTMGCLGHEGTSCLCLLHKLMDLTQCFKSQQYLLVWLIICQKTIGLQQVRLVAIIQKEESEELHEIEVTKHGVLGLNGKLKKINVNRSRWRIPKSL